MEAEYSMPNDSRHPAFAVIIAVPVFCGVANGELHVMGAFTCAVQGGAPEDGFNGGSAVASQPEPHALAEVKIFPAFVAPAVPVIIHALQLGIGFKCFAEDGGCRR